MPYLIDIPFTPFGDPEEMKGWIREMRALQRERRDNFTELEFEALSGMIALVGAWVEQATGTYPQEAERA